MVALGGFSVAAAAALAAPELPVVAGPVPAVTTTASAPVLSVAPSGSNSSAPPQVTVGGTPGSARTGAIPAADVGAKASAAPSVGSSVGHSSGPTLPVPSATASAGGTSPAGPSSSGRPPQGVTALVALAPTSAASVGAAVGTLSLEVTLEP